MAEHLNDMSDKGMAAADEKRDFLVEIGTEELPPKALLRLAQAFANGVRDGLAKAGLGHGESKYFATPRRLAVLVEALSAAQPDRVLERRGPALAAAFDDNGCPTPAAKGFARSCGVEVEDLEKLETDKGAWLVFRANEPGRKTRELLPEIVERALAGLPIPKRMRWGSMRVEFVRPVHWVVMLFGDETIDAEILGIRAGRETRGHRFHHPESLYLAEPAVYAPMLATHGRVVADFEARREAIRAQVVETARGLGGTAVIDEALLDEVTALVEWPVALAGSFETRFLEVPAEALISTMQDNQKYFPVVDAAGKLMPHFITVANIESRDMAQVRAGNERVVRPRFTDAAFFWNQDRKRPLASRLDELKSVVFQEKLGTLYDKVQRVAALARTIARETGHDVVLSERAALLSKCDLMTSMVGEFPALQGVMGRYYAAHDGEPAEVAQAIDEHYMPRFAGDRLPTTGAGQAVALADRLDTLVGIFAIGQAPTGEKDPFGLRRAALGALRIMIARQLDLDLELLLEEAAQRFPAGIVGADTVAKVFEFMMERLRGYYAEEGVRPDVFEAVFARRPTRPLDFDRRVRAVTAFRELPAAASLAAANKRIRNILKQAEEAVSTDLDVTHLVDPAEKMLAERVAALAEEVGPLLDRHEYTEALARLATLREPVDTFFDRVMVMAEDAELRRNRLALLNGMSNLFLRVADLSRLQS
ncbi:MAG: glycine--tRNA ligase subunit beta [Gammaproteobacteria bacterium]